MVGLLFILLTIALVDSTSMIPIGLVPLTGILGGSRPLLGALSFLAGIFVVYAGTGLLIFLGFDSIFDQLALAGSRWWNQPNIPELFLQLIVGLILIVFAWRRYRLPPSDIAAGSSAPISPIRAFSLGAGLTVIGMPGAVPYFGAIDQILRMDLDKTRSIAALIFYNVIFLAPFMALVTIRLILPNRSEAIFSATASVTSRWGSRLIAGCALLLGIVLVADSVGWFAGSPLLPTSSAPP